MDRRSWPWKKKSSDKAAAGSESAASQGDQDSDKKPVCVQISFEQYSHLIGLKDEVKTHEEKVQRLDDQIKDLNEKLSAANAEITAKDGMVKQHAKVAEEAVSGWEKAESEALALKNHLESVTLSKLTAEDRAAHLDGALKECMRQIRNLKVEHEQKLQDVVLTKTKQMDKLKLEFEGKIGEFEEELLRSAAENDALSTSLQERSSMLIRIREEKSQAEAEIEHLKNNIESCERDLNSLKYEVHIVSKELEIRNEEKNMCMRSAEAANKQHMEGVKKIAKLEAECQRLRGLVRKKLPGPAALAQMKLEVDSLGRDYGDSRMKRSPIKPSSPLMSPMLHTSQVSEFSLDSIQKVHKENELLTERLFAMEAETKMLKEALAKRNSELQTSRNLCAKTASRLQTLEAQLLHTSPSKSSVQNSAELSTVQNASNPPSFASMSEDGTDDARSLAGSWSTTVASELPLANTDNKNGMKLSKAESVNHLELMCDFLEMEKLACLSNDSTENVSTDNKKSDNVKSDSSVEVISRKDHESEKQCDSDTTLNNVYSNSAVSDQNREKDGEQAPVTRLQSRIYKVLQSVSKDADIEKILADIRRVMHDASHLSEKVGCSETACNGHDPSEDSISTAEKEINMSKENNVERETVHVVSRELVDSVSQIHDFVLFLAKEARAVHDPSSETNILSQKVDEFSVTLDKVLRSQKTSVDFIFDLSHVLAEASKLKINVLGSKTSEVEIHSPDCIDKVALPENKAIQEDSSGERYQNGCAHTSVPEIPDDGNIALSCKFTSKEFEELKQEKERVANDLVGCTENLETAKFQLQETEQLLAEVKSQLVSSQKSNSLAETQLKCMAESYRTLETRSAELETDANLLRGKIESLENELLDEKRNHYDAVARCKELEEQLQRIEGCSVCSAAEADLKSKQDNELAAAAEKLAECQETMLLLGKQLRSLRPQAEQIMSPYNEPSENPQDEPTTTTTNLNPQDLDQTESDSCVSPNLQRLGAESPNIYNSPNSPSDNEAANISMRSPIGSKHTKHRHSKSSSSSSSGPTPEKPSRGFSRFFSSKGK